MEFILAYAAGPSNKKERERERLGLSSRLVLFAFVRVLALAPASRSLSVDTVVDERMQVAATAAATSAMLDADPAGAASSSGKRTRVARRVSLHTCNGTKVSRVSR